MRDLRALELALHRGDVGLAEAEGLQVGQAPVRLAEARLELDGAAIGRDRFLLASRRLQRVALAEPDPGLLRILPQQFLVDADRPVVIADAREHHGPQVAEARAARFGREQLVDLRERFHRLVVPVQDDGKIVPRRLEAWRQFEAAREQVLGVAVAADAGGDLGQHADRRHVGRKLLQVIAQQRLGHGDAAFGQRERRFQQARIVRGVADVLGIRLVRTRGIAHGEEVIAQRPPGIGHRGLQADGLAQHGHGFLAMAGVTERKPQFAMRGTGAGLGGHERPQDLERPGRIPRAPVRHAQQQCRRRVVGHRSQDLARLLGGESWRGREQLLGVRQRHVQGPDRFRSAGHAGFACFDTTADE